MESLCNTRVSKLLLWLKNYPPSTVSSVSFWKAFTQMPAYMPTSDLHGITADALVSTQPHLLHATSGDRLMLLYHILFLESEQEVTNICASSWMGRVHIHTAYVCPHPTHPPALTAVLKICPPPLRSSQGNVGTLGKLNKQMNKQKEAPFWLICILLPSITGAELCSGLHSQGVSLWRSHCTCHFCSMVLSNPGYLLWDRKPWW